MEQEIRDLPQITFEFLNRICLLRGWGSQGKFVEDRQTLDKNLLQANYFNKIFYHHTNINPTKIKKVTTVPYYKHKLMRPSIGVVNLQKVLTTCFGHEIA